MPSKNTSVIAARVKDEVAVKLGEIAENKGLSIAKLIEELVNDYEEKGVTPISYAVSDNFSERIESKLDELREREYPESFLDSMKEQMLQGLSTQISMLPRKYDSRRMREEC